VIQNAPKYVILNEQNLTKKTVECGPSSPHPFLQGSHWILPPRPSLCASILVPSTCGPHRRRHLYT